MRNTGNECSACFWEILWWLHEPADFPPRHYTYYWLIDRSHRPNDRAYKQKLSVEDNHYHIGIIYYYNFMQSVISLLSPYTYTDKFIIVLVWETVDHGTTMEQEDSQPLYLLVWIFQWRVKYSQKYYVILCCLCHRWEPASIRNL